MILLLPGNAKRMLSRIDAGSGLYGWLLTPRRTMTQAGLFGMRYAVDNECYTLGPAFDPDRYLRALRRIADAHGPEGCLFASAPDVLYDPAATLARLPDWSAAIRGLGLPVALVAQDGLERLEIPWDEFDALFVGGSTCWKLDKAAAWLTAEAERRGKWTHYGRINSVQRASRLRARPHSVDGTAWAKHPAEYAVQWQRWIEAGQPRQHHLW